MRTRFHLLLAAALFLVASPALADRTDELVLYNGNTITGEVKSLQQGKLKFKTDHADTILQYSLETDATYRERKYNVSTSLSSIQTRQDAREDIVRDNLDFIYTRYHKNRYFSAGGLAFSRNTELGFDFRSQLGYSFGRNFRQTNRANLLGGLGLAVGREKPIGEDPNDYYLSAMISGSYQFFLYNYPKTDIVVDLVLMPGITDWPRARVEFNASLRREVIRDFTINFSAYDSYDSDPPTEGTTLHDFGVILSVGWTF